MNNELKNILSNSDEEVNEQQLLDYLNNQLSEADSHTVEKSMAADEFVNDAVEGLQKIEHKKDMQAYVEQLNNDLQKQIAKNKNRKNKRRLKDSTNNYVTIIIILVLLIISFLILKKYLDARHVDRAGAGQQLPVK